MMNCKQAEQLIPLFVEADLDANEMEKVNAHLDTCIACRETESEFRSSQLALRTTAMPTFDETMMTAMRAAVMQQTQPTKARFAYVELLQPLWDWKFAMAACAMVLLISGILITHHNSESLTAQKKTDVNVSDDATFASKQNSNELEKKSRHSLPIVQPQIERKTIIASNRKIAYASPKQFNSGIVRIVDNQIAAATFTPFEVDVNSVRRTNDDTTNLLLPLAPQPENATATIEKSASEPEMLRMEIQTADPNIKIIWLTPKEPVRTNPATDTK